MQRDGTDLFYLEKKKSVPPFSFNDFIPEASIYEIILPKCQGVNFISLITLH